jgi:hypothetical protein
MKLAMRPEIRALGWMADGSPIYPIQGADPDPTGAPAGGSEGGGAEGAPEGGTGEGATATGVVDPQAGPDPTAAQIEVLTRRLAAADKAKGEMESKLRAIDDQGKNELQKAQDQVKELTAKLELTQQAATRARLEREILKHPGYIWHDPEVVLALVDMDSIEIDEETGKVTGVYDALKKLAASKPFLLKGKNPDGGGQGGGGSANGGKPAGSSGTNPSGGTPNNAEKRREELAKKYKL